MLNIVSNNIFINKIKYPKSTLSFRSKSCCDEFIKASTIKGKKMPDKADSKSNTNDEKRDIIDAFSQKKAKLPICFDMVFGSTMGYLKENLNAKQYAEIFLSEAPFVFQTAQYGIDKESFSEKHAKEIELVKNLNFLCDSFKSSECQEDEFNTEFNKIMKDFIK